MMDRIVSGLSESSIKVRLAAVRYKIFYSCDLFCISFISVPRDQVVAHHGHSVEQVYERSLSANVKSATDECCKSFEVEVKCLFYCKYMSSPYPFLFPYPFQS